MVYSVARQDERQTMSSEGECMVELQRYYWSVEGIRSEAVSSGLDLLCGV